MNPRTSDQGGTEDYSGSEALDPALAGPFALVVTAAVPHGLSRHRPQAICRAYLAKRLVKRHIPKIIQAADYIWENFGTRL